jgi:DNA-binding PadR family transcriptional regulator
MHGSMNTFETAVLEVLGRSADGLGWYQIERRLSNMMLVDRPLLPGALSILRDRGFIVEVRDLEELQIRYAITEAGRQRLNT